MHFSSFGKGCKGFVFSFQERLEWLQVCMFLEKATAILILNDTSDGTSFHVISRCRRDNVDNVSNRTVRYCLFKEIWLEKTRKALPKNHCESSSLARGSGSLTWVTWVGFELKRSGQECRASPLPV